ncbi:MAG: hypothetical protein JRN61_03730, partial [Nitrososphaerota archaeon]|nr:hypothetical protein [Nitrososphaerota archaeon]
IRKRATEKGAGFSNKDRYFLLVFESSISSNLVGLIMSATGGTPIILIALLALSALSLVLSTILVSLIIFTHNF